MIRDGGETQVFRYGFLYVLLANEDYALLLGSLGLFIILALVMYLTRRFDWYALGKAGETVPGPDATETPV